MNNRKARYRSRAVSTLIGLALAASAAWAVDPFTIRDIRVEGLQRVEPGTIFASIPMRIGDSYDDQKGAAAIRALFALGLFKDVRLEVNGDVLIVVVEERPTISDINFVGGKEFDKDTLTKALRDIGLADGRPLDQSLTDRAEQEIKRQYLNRGLYGAEVVTTVTPIERNRVNITFSLTEGEPSTIKEIRVVGAKAFSESTLRNLFDLDTGGWLSWYTKSNRYSRAKLNADLETMRSYYLSRGYLEFRIDSTQVAISPNKQDLSITINIFEGERFAVAAVRLEGNYLDKDDEFKSLVSVKPGQVYNADEVALTTKAFTELFGKFGFAFARVEARSDIDRPNNRVTVVLQADPSRRAYVRRINIAGNNRTRDEVIRREFRQFESAWYDGDKIKLSRDRVDRLGFFKEISLETEEVSGAPDQVDLNLTVVEKPTGSLTLGAGFSSSDKLSLTFGVKQENVFGSGNYLALDVNTSKTNRNLGVTSTNPYFTPDGVSRTFDIYHRIARPTINQSGDYFITTTGGGIRFGVPFSELDTVYFGAGLENTKITNGLNIPAAYTAYINQFGASSITVPLTVGWAQDDRDSAIAPTTGRLKRLNGELAVIGDAKYFKGTAQYQQYFPISKQYMAAFNGEIVWGKGIGGPFPVFKNVYGGGQGSVRGYEGGSLGPVDPVTNTPLGGAKKVTLNGELFIPFPGAGNDRTLRLYGFADLGGIFGENQKLSFSEMRASTGIGVSWISPVGPLRISYAVPVRKQPGDRIQKLQFQIGSTF